ncbi:MAG: Nif3-like dinuclear metal center hexameric protein [Firmicutes bacterium]|nr:Nif3-like dinuclear metal center hexameric protein [Bacillota bacterium]
MIKVRNIMEYLEASADPSQIDALKAGNPEDVVTGIVTTFMPTYAALHASALERLNVIVAHESPFYHHREGLTDILTDDPVFEAKIQLIRTHRLNVIRCHDYLHRANPDAIVEGLLHELGWEPFVESSWDSTSLPLHVMPVTLPSLSGHQLISLVKSRLHLPFVHVMGPVDTRITRVGLLPGYTGSGQIAIPYLREARLDALLIGEGPEWELPEYLRDAQELGQAPLLIVIGHSASEQYGMKSLAARLASAYPSVSVRFIPTPPVFTVV